MPGEPVPNQRARKGRGGHWYTPEKTRRYREVIQTAWMVEGRPRVEGRLFAVMEFVCRAPGQLDVDNLAKGVLDALTGLAYDDDKQVVRLVVTKRETDDGEEPHTTCIVRSDQAPAELVVSWPP